MNDVLTKDLLKIKTLSKSHAKHIEVVPYRGETNSLFRDIALAIHPVLGDCRAAMALGWIEGATLKDVGCRAAIGMSTYLLVKYNNRLYWVPAPRKGEPYEYCWWTDEEIEYMTGRLDQLFV